MAVEPLRLAIVEASPQIHLAIAGVLEGATDLRIVEHARSLPELVIADPEHLDVLLADLRSCIGPGATALQRLRARHPGLRLVVTTMDCGREYEEAIARLAAHGTVHKTRLADQLVRVLRRLSL